ncbi:hypothetical protein HAX54_042403, partial [Datura stramonium]|nr:hypothetical protein [Datura stramonium]
MDWDFDGFWIVGGLSSIGSPSLLRICEALAMFAEKRMFGIRIRRVGVMSRCEKDLCEVLHH